MLIYYVHLLFVSWVIEMPPVCEGLNFTFTVLTAADIMKDALNLTMQTISEMKFCIQFCK